MYPFMTLDDETEIVHSEMYSDAKLKSMLRSRMSIYFFGMQLVIFQIISGKIFNPPVFAGKGIW